MTYVPEIQSPFLLVNQCAKKQGITEFQLRLRRKSMIGFTSAFFFNRRNAFIPFDTMSPSIPAYSRLSYIFEESDGAQTGYP